MNVLRDVNKKLRSALSELPLVQVEVGYDCKYLPKAILSELLAVGWLDSSDNLLQGGLPWSITMLQHEEICLKLAEKPQQAF